MDRWQYRHFITRPREFTRLEFASGSDHPDERSGEFLTSVLERWGADGWEMVSSTNIEGDRLLFVFKRPVSPGIREVTPERPAKPRVTARK